VSYTGTGGLATWQSDTRSVRKMKSQVSVKCACESCGQHLEYDSANGGEVIQCPTCASKVLLPKARGLHPSLWKFVLIVAPVCVLVTTLCQMSPLKRRLHGVTQRVDGTSGTALELSNTVLSARAVQERRAKRLEEQEFQHRKVAAWATKASYDPSTENRRGYGECAPRMEPHDAGAAR
jgi:DNA-directed RNA polymerase subunit RPC12/RpoP